MKSFVIYVPGSGEIVSACEAPAAHVPPEGAAPGQDGLAIMHGAADPDLDCVRGGRIQRKHWRTRRAQADEAAWSLFRMERRSRLEASDWTQIPDAPLTEAQRRAWAAYRAALRDLPATTNDPANPDWPDAPI